MSSVCNKIRQSLRTETHGGRFLAEHLASHLLRIRHIHTELDAADAEAFLVDIDGAHIQREVQHHRFWFEIDGILHTVVNRHVIFESIIVHLLILRLQQDIGVLDGINVSSKVRTAFQLHTQRVFEIRTGYAATLGDSHTVSRSTLSIRCLERFCHSFRNSDVSVALLHRLSVEHIVERRYRTIVLLDFPHGIGYQ